ncbi:hypothetical protein DBR37_12265 [Herminiimonas sp. KBW02]|uniref:hypothetical protein n=1 Tax=Herminiimonas sp. KBW02 TaxID=2153363 RepID=UPI000F5A7F60|nr:hypothetical protein [Herminiimonas sp. KBW02]RQO33901.1 hypothetical protein DBR37_12265 [Herminiimonas sp. KBW02]
MTEEHHSRAALETHAFALMGRLHVNLRRQSGRIIDIEYMRIDPAYCRYLLKMASLSTSEEVQELGQKLQEVFFGAEGLFVRTEPRQPLLTRLQEPAAAPVAAAAAPGPAPAAPETGDPVDRGYIGRLR